MFPGAIQTWVPLRDDAGGILGDEILAEHHNEAYDEITAIENALGVNLANMIVVSGANAFAGNQSFGGFNITNVGTLDIASMATNWTNAGRTVADMGIVTTIDLNGGSIDGTPIGAAVLSTIAGSTLDITGVATPTLSTTAQSVLELHRDTNTTNALIDIVFQADNDVNAIAEYGKISTRILDEVEATRAGDMTFSVPRLGSAVKIATMTNIALTVNPSRDRFVGLRIFGDIDFDLLRSLPDTNAITVGSSSDLGYLGIDGQRDRIQLLAQGFGGQTANIFVVEKSDGTDYFVVGETGGAGTIGFYGTAPIIKQLAVGVNAAAIHAALVNLGLIT